MKPEVVIATTKPNIVKLSSTRPQNFTFSTIAFPTKFTYSYVSELAIEYGTVEWGGFELGDITSGGATSIEQPLLINNTEVPKVI